MKKNNLKSVRISDEVLSVVESYQGEGFNQKFENLVIDFKKSRSEREAYLAQLDETIACRKSELKSLLDKISKSRMAFDFLNAANSMKLKIDEFRKAI